MTDKKKSTNPEVAGPQPVPDVPDMPQTSEEFRQLLTNPGAPAENQAAPSQESLNPHIYG